MKINRTQQPPIIIPSKIELSGTEIATAANGVRIYSLNNSDQDVVRFSFVFEAGSSLQEKAFSASTTANMLSEGTQNYTAHQIAEALDFIGSYFDVTIDRDYSVVTFCTLKKFLDRTLEIAEEIILRPVFDKEELEVYCSKRKQRLAVERSKVSFKARELFTATLFGKDHPYGISSAGELYDNLTIEDLQAFYDSHYAAQGCFVVASGSIDARTAMAIKSIAEKLPPATSAKPNVTANTDAAIHNNATPKFPEPTPSAEAILEHKGAVQSAIRIGRLLFNRNHEDFIAMQVAATVLGGYFGSRLVHNLREERGYTYGIFAAMVNLRHSGYLAIATEVATEATKDAIDQIYYEIERMRVEPVSQHELSMVKNIVIGEVMRIMDGPFGIADVTIENIQNDKDNLYVNLFIEQVNAVTPEKIVEIARKYWTRDSFSTVIVGDWQEK